VSSAVSIYYQIADALNVKLTTKTEKSALAAIEKALRKTKRRQNMV